MTTHFMHELEQLKRRMFVLVAMVEDNVSLAVKAVQERSETLAQQAVRADETIDEAEVAIEEECLKLLALYQPVAGDLRFIVAILKVNSDLERIGDLAVNIAKSANALYTLAPVPVPFDLEVMAAEATQMLKQSLDALLDNDVQLAVEVCKADDEVDAINRDMHVRVKTAISEHPAHLDALMHLLTVSRHLERVSDHATNIAENVIYLVNGRIVRHSDELR